MSEDDKPQGKPIVKAKLPAAKSIKRPDFTPHGIGGGPGRGSASRPSRLTAAQARKRKKIAIIVGIATGVIVIAAVTVPVVYVATRPEPKVEVTGAFGKEPKVEIPKKMKPGKALKVTDAKTGKGPKVANGDTTYVKFVFYKFSPKPADRKKLVATYTRPQGEQIVTMVIGKSGVKGVDKGMVGQTVGSRVLLEVPPGQGFGQEGQQLGITNTDSILFVMDVLGTYKPNTTATGAEQKLDDKNLPKVSKPGKAGQAPKVEVPKVDPPDKLQAKTLIQGNGKALTKNDTPLVQYEAKIWKGGRVFDSTYQRGGSPIPMPLNTTGGAQGFFKGLTGQQVGSRVLLVIPPNEGYGKKGNPQAGIKGDDTLVFVVDIVGALATT